MFQVNKVWDHVLIESLNCPFAQIYQAIMSDISPRSLIYPTSVAVIATVCFVTMHNLRTISPEYARHSVYGKIMR